MTPSPHDTPDEPVQPPDEKLRQSIAGHYDRAGVADRFEGYQVPGTAQFRHRRPERKAVERILRRLPSQASILDMPCGTGRYLPALAPFPFVLAGDVSEEMLRIARAACSEVFFARMDGYDLPLKANAVHTTLCLRFLHHLPDPRARRQCLAELARVTSHTLVCTYFDSRSLKHLIRRLRAWRRGRPSLRFAVTFPELRRELDEAGFTVSRVIKPWGILSENRVLVCAKKGAGGGEQEAGAAPASPR